MLVKLQYYACISKLSRQCALDIKLNISFGLKNGKHSFCHIKAIITFKYVIFMLETFFFEKKEQPNALLCSIPLSEK